MTTILPKAPQRHEAACAGSYQASATRAYMVVDILPGAERTAFNKLSSHPAVESIDIVTPHCFVLVMRGETEEDLVQGTTDVLASAHPWATFVEFAAALVPAA